MLSKILNRYPVTFLVLNFPILKIQLLMSKIEILKDRKLQTSFFQIDILNPQILHF